MKCSGRTYIVVLAVYEAHSRHMQLGQPLVQKVWPSVRLRYVQEHRIRTPRSQRAVKQVAPRIFVQLAPDYRPI